MSISREEVKGLVEKCEHPTLAGSPYCMKRRREKDAYCSGCESELGCEKVRGLELAVATSELFLAKMEHSIVAARTVEEAKGWNSVVERWNQAVKNL